MPLYFVEKVVIYRRNFGKIKSPENPPYLEKQFAKYRLWPKLKAAVDADGPSGAVSVEVEALLIA